MTTGSKASGFCAHFATMLADGEYNRIQPSEKRNVRNQERTALRRSTRAAVNAHFAGTL